MPRFIVIPPDEIARARVLYEATEIPVDDIAKMLGIARRTLNQRVKAWGWAPRSAKLRGLDAASRAQVGEIAKLAAPHVATIESETLIDRVRSAVKREIMAIEAVLARVEGAQLRSADAERAARTLATLVKTLREVAALQRDEKPDNDDREDEFRDIEEFRAELIDKLERIRAREGG